MFCFKIQFQIENANVFLLNEFMHHPRPPQLHHHQVRGWGGAPPWSDELGLKGVKGKFFLKEYLDLFDLLQIFKITQIFKSGLFLKSSICCVYEFVVVPTVLYILNIKMSIYKVTKNDKNILIFDNPVATMWFMYNVQHPLQLRENLKGLQVTKIEDF